MPDTLYCYHTNDILLHWLQQGLKHDSCNYMDANDSTLPNQDQLASWVNMLIIVCSYVPVEVIKLSPQRGDIGYWFLNAECFLWVMYSTQSLILTVWLISYANLILHCYWTCVLVSMSVWLFSRVSNLISLISPLGFGQPSSSVWYCRKCGTRYRILLLLVCCSSHHHHLAPTVQCTRVYLATHTQRPPSESSLPVWLDFLVTIIPHTHYLNITHLCIQISLYHLVCLRACMCVSQVWPRESRVWITCSLCNKHCVLPQVPLTSAYGLMWADMADIL